MDYSLEIKKLSNKLINVSILAAALFITPALISSLLRYLNIGWHNIYILHILLTLIVYNLFFFRNKLALLLKAHMLIIVFILAALGGLMNFMLIGGHYFAFPALVIATLILGRRIGLLYLIIYVVVYVTIWILHEYEFFKVDLNFNEYIRNKFVWASMLFGYIFGLLTIIYVGGEFYKLFTNSIKNISNKSNELKDALEKHKYSEERFSIFMNKSPFPTSIVNKDGEYVYTNSALQRLYQGNTDTSKNLSPNEVFPKPIADKITDANQYVLSKNKTFTFDIEAEENGLYSYYRVSKFPLTSPDNKPLIGSITIDETKQKRAEFQLEISEKKYRSIFEGSVDSFIFINLEGYILDCNNSLCKLLGYNKEELIGNYYFSIHDHKYSSFETEFINESIENIEITNRFFEKKFIKKDGTEVPVEMYLNKLELSNKIFFWAIIRDLTEKKRLEKEIYQSMINAEENERARYARELHDGLGPLLSTCKIYFHTLSSIDDQEQKTEHIKRTGELLDDAISSIREISNNLSPDILRRYGIEQALKSFSGKLKNITEIEFQIKSNLDNRLSDIQEITLYRTLIELINNSVKYSEASTIQVILDYEIDRQVLSVKYIENGKGFDYEKTINQSKGFGLINLENRIKKIGGNYTFNSEEGKGVLVQISLKTDVI